MDKITRGQGVLAMKVKNCFVLSLAMSIWPVNSIAKDTSVHSRSSWRDNGYQSYCVDLVVSMQPDVNDIRWYSDKMSQYDTGCGVNVPKITECENSIYPCWIMLFHTVNESPHTIVAGLLPNGERPVFRTPTRIVLINGLIDQSIFVDGFETGDVGQWTNAIGESREREIFFSDFESGDLSTWYRVVM